MAEERDRPRLFFKQATVKGGGRTDFGLAADKGNPAWDADHADQASCAGGAD